MNEQNNRRYPTDPNYNNYRRTTYSPQQGYAPQPNYQPQAPRKSYIGVVIIFVVATMLVIGGVVVFLLFHDQILGGGSGAGESAPAVVGILDENGNRISDSDAGLTSDNILYNTLCRDYAELLEKPAIKAATVDGGSIPKNAEVELLAYVQDSDFIKVSYNGKTGYVFAAMFTPEDSANGRYVKYCIARHHANLRSQPGSNNADNIGEIYTDSPVQCTGEYDYVNNQKYLKVVYRGQTGYVLDAVFSDTMDGPTYRGD